MQIEGIIKIGSPRSYSSLIKGTKWSIAEESWLRMNFRKHSDEYIAHVLGRSKMGVYWKRRQLNLPRENKGIRGITLTKTLDKMQRLILICENTSSPYRLQLAKEELRRLSGL